MTEQEAYSKWYAEYKRHSPNRPTAKHGWQAALEWASGNQQNTNKTHKNIHVDGDMYKKDEVSLLKQNLVPAPLVRLTEGEINALIDEDVFLGNCYEIANAIQDAMIEKNGGKHE